MACSYTRLYDRVIGEDEIHKGKLKGSCMSMGEFRGPPCMDPGLLRKSQALLTRLAERKPNTQVAVDWAGAGIWVHAMLAIPCVV